MQATLPRAWRERPSNPASGESPWGPIEHVTEVADGIAFVSTSSHGGYWLSPERWAQVLAKFPDCKPFCGVAGWLEEDCDWRFAALTFPEHFPADALAAAQSLHESMKNYRPEWRR